MADKEPKPYDERTDLEKIRSQWKKLSGLLSRSDWSAAVVRAATATELAVTFAIRYEFTQKSELDTSFIDGLLGWVNGLIGKVDKLLLPLLERTEKHNTVKKLYNLAEKINNRRNMIVHRGEFCDKRSTITLINHCKEFVDGIVQIYDPKFILKEIKDLTDAPPSTLTPAGSSPRPTETAR